MTCVCGYQMCYVCRKDIGSGGEGYRHFCDHFRPNGKSGCTECDRCDLYQIEDDQAVLKKAKEQAELKWLKKEGEANGDVKKKVAQKYDNDHSGWFVKSWHNRPGFEELLDMVVEFVVE